MSTGEMKYVHEIHRLLKDRKIILVYEGEFTQQITKSVLAMAERNLESVGENESIKRKVFNVMVECLQNITKHADDPEATPGPAETNGAVFMIGTTPEHYNIISGNPIENQNVAGLKEKLEQINTLDKDGLKKLYKEIITNGSLSDKGGAGLGFVDMARKSGNKLNFVFEPVNDEYSFFVLQTSINRNK